MIGRVVSSKMQNTAVVIVEGHKKHPVYKKSFKRSKKYFVDDPFNVKDGDIVIFEKVRPISKLKHWRITKVLGRDIVSLEQAELKAEAKEAIEEVMPEEKEELESRVEPPKASLDKVGSPESSEEIKDQKPKGKSPSQKEKVKDSRTKKAEPKAKKGVKS
ncbi:mitochondrial small ribosomal subunit protein uS17m [Candidatus Daviesbacteria bacterium]|nr:mitochondrial small ribosomal subunit protein uS17m [Candidatus Daviesbacteria bacterium]